MNTPNHQHDGSLYCATDENLFRQQQECLELMYDFNHTRPKETARRAELLRQMLAESGEGSMIEPPMKANWGARFLHLGSHVYINHGLSLVDDTHIHIGDCTKLGPNVTLATAGHPILPELRGEHAMQYNLPIRIGRNCWLGANVCVLPGVSIGDNSVIGAGSVVTRDIPANVVAAGVPCRILRPIGDRDRQFYHANRPINPNSCH